MCVKEIITRENLVKTTGDRPCNRGITKSKESPPKGQVQGYTYVIKGDTDQAISNHKEESKTLNKIIPCTKMDLFPCCTSLVKTYK